MTSLQQITSLIESFARLPTARDSDRCTVEAQQRKRNSDGSLVPAVTVASAQRIRIAARSFITAVLRPVVSATKMLQVAAMPVQCVPHI